MSGITAVEVNEWLRGLKPENNMYVQDFTGDKDELLAEAFKSPKLHPKKNPDIETALRVVGDTVAKKAKDTLQHEINTDLMDAVAMYEVNNGEYADVPEGDNQRDDYESGMDDVVEAAFEPWEAYLSADWLGKNTIDTGLWNSTDMDRTLVLKLAELAAKEVFKQLTSDKTPVQVLSNAGIVKADVEALLETNKANTGEERMAQSAEDLESVVAKIKEYVGKDFDQMTVYEDLEMILEEDDEILASSAAGRIGINADEMAVLQMAALDMDDGPTDVCEMVAAYKIPSGRSKTAAAKKEKAAAKAKDNADAVDPIVLGNLKECGVGDTAMAEALGVSRSTYTNYIKGKTAFVPDGDQYGVVRDALVERANLLLAALAELDGTDLTQVA